MKRKPGARRRFSPASTLRRFWLALLVVLIASAVAGFYGLRWKGFEPQGVRVSGNSVVPTQQIVRAAGIAGNRNLWLQNMGAAANRVQAIPYILKATMHRWPPAQLTIVVEERGPFAVVESRGQTALVDQNLRVLSLNPDPRETLPMVAAFPPFNLAPAGGFLVDSRLAALRDDTLALQAARVPLRGLSFDRYRQLTVKLRSGVDVLFGDDSDLSKKIPLLQPILTQTARGRPIRAVDLRAIGTPVIVYK